MGTVRSGMGSLFLVCMMASAVHADPPAQQDLAKKALQVLKANCYRCHGQDGANEGGFNYVLDRRQLVSRRKVVPGEPAKSKILRRILNAVDPMPPAEEKVRPRPDDIALLKKWIEAGAPEIEVVAKQSFLSPEYVLQTMRNDLERLPERDRRFIRYFTLTHLVNAGLSPDELQSFRHGLSKLINSLSWGRHVVVPQAIDAAKTIMRIDLRDFGWNEQTWETLLERNPYGIAMSSADAKACVVASGCKLPYLRADWFVAVASRPPLYHDILQLPRTENELLKLLRLDLAENIRQERVARAGFNGSGVSRNNRLIERHEAGNTVYWKSYDFGNNTGKSNLFAHPIGPGDDEHCFVQDGGEIIFTLPNGLQAYFLIDKHGQRIDKGPTSIVSDPRRPDRAVENGLSCIACHARGIIEKADQVRDHVVKNPSAFPRGTVDTILALYPPKEKMANLMRADAKRFQDAVARTGAPLSATEPIAALAQRFESEMDLSLAAAEAGVPSADFLKALERFPHLAKELGPLRIEGGTVQRQVYVDAFGDLVQAMRLGEYVLPRSAAYTRLIARGHSLLEKGDVTSALKHFTEAIDREPSNPLGHAGRGDAFRQRKEFTQAVSAYTEALRLDPLSATVFNNRGMAYHGLGESDKALADFTAAIRLSPRFAIAYHNRGAAHFAKDDVDRAIADYSEALKLDDRATVTFNNRGFAYLEKGEHDRAIADFNQALRLAPRFTVALNNRGLAFLRKKHFDRAVADFSAAIAIDPKFAQAYFNRASAYERLRNTGRAQADRKKALELDPNLNND
jgi:tetratricopeptide (TPR) repeat protein/mono/diheme cytochrome c family protein